MPPNPAPESQKNLAAVVAVWLLAGVAASQAVMVALAPRKVEVRAEEARLPEPEKAPAASPEAPAAASAPEKALAEEGAPADAAEEDPFRPEALPQGSEMPAEVITPPSTDLLALEAMKLQAGSASPEPEKAAGPAVPVVKAAAAEPDELFLRERAPLDTPISDETVLAELDAGMALRSQGDLLGAVSHLRNALRIQPDHPKLIYQTAVTLDMMSQPQKAQPLWESLATLGKGAGRYHTLARERLVDGVKVSAEEAEEHEGRLSVISAKVEPVDDPGNGERVKVRLTIRRNQEEPVKPEEVADGTLAFGIHFFDVVNRRRIDRSTCITPEQTLKCLTGDADWAEGTEEFEFEYYQPIMTADELKRFGMRKYYGYAFEVMYRGKLQDVAAEPVQMARFARDIPLDRALAPEGTATAPDGSLFPGLPPGQVTEPAPVMAPPGTGDVDLPLPERGLPGR